MSNSTHNITLRDASSFSTERKKGGAAPVTSSAFSAVSDVRGALQACSDAVKADRAVTANSFGRATSVLN